MEFTVHISNGFISGALSGAFAGICTAVIAIAIVCLNPMMALLLWWNGDSVLRIFAKGCLICAPLGAVAGAIIGLLGAPWWAVIPAVIALYAVYTFIYNKINRNRW